MKKIVLGVLMSSLGVSLYGAEWESEFKKILLRAVLSEEENPLEELKQFRADRENDIGDTDLSAVEIEGYGAVKTFIASLEPDFFKNRKPLCEYFSLEEELHNLENEKTRKDTVFSYIDRALNSSRTINYDYDYSLAKHVFEQCRINIDKLKFGQYFLGTMLDNKIENMFFDSEDKREFLEKISDLVSGSRTAALLENIWMSTVECLCKKIKLPEWKEIFSKNGEIDSEAKKYCVDRLRPLNADAFPRKNMLMLELGQNADPSSPEDGREIAKRDHVAEIIERALKTNNPDAIMLAAYAIKEHKLEIPLCNYTYDKTHNIAQAVLDPKLRVPGRVALKEIIDPYKGVDDALLAIARDCLLGKKLLTAIGIFLTHLDQGKVDIAKSWDEIVKQDGEVFERREPILRLLNALRSDLCPNRNFPESPKKGAVWYIRDFLTDLINPDDSPEGRWKAECATYAYKKSVDNGSSIDLDKELLSDDNTETRTLGQQLDSSIRIKLRWSNTDQLKENPTFKFFELVRSNQWATPKNDPEGNWFRSAFLETLCERDEDTQGRFLYYVYCFEEDDRKALHAAKEKFAPYGSMLDQLSPNLFPNKQSFQSLFMPDKPTSETTWNKEKDRECLEALALESLEISEFIPLVISGYKVYKGLYKTEIDFAGLKYKDTDYVFCDFVANQKNHPLFELLPASVPDNPSTPPLKPSSVPDDLNTPSSKPSKPSKTVLESPKKNVTNTSTSFWKKALGVGIVGAVVYGLYKYNKKPNHEAAVEVA